jgi:hypothetical protein
VTLHKGGAHHLNRWFGARPDRLLFQPSGLANALLRVPLLGTTPSQPPPLRGGGANSGVFSPQWEATFPSCAAESSERSGRG